MTDITVYVVLATVVAIILAALTFFQRGRGKEENGGVPAPRPRIGNEGGRAAVGNRAVANRNARARMRAAARRRDDSDVEEEEEPEIESEIALPEGKIGKKKLAKLQAKAERRATREAEERERAEKKEREERAAEERKKIEEQKAEEEAKRLEQEEKEREERRIREHEEYLKMKVMFEVEEEGFDDNVDETKEKDLVAKFVQFIQDEKVVVLEELAARFSLKTKDAIDRVTELQKNGTLTGVIDDRGKFIYISQEELQDVVKFIKQRGRISVSELAESSNKLITLTPVNRETSCAS
ncbi:DDRGK domain-containing protein 1-like isoform X2 [Penaeus monodon]|uniref:DDRGK domain-containing protein 1-like isoform X2 n=1 Tax=Penaeus monodon TaxID=6687 RepID=UPI0018A7B569|nr:DDRGK domain-containing protein 1-like isoform X2 [Penaeus monodon]